MSRAREFAEQQFKGQRITMIDGIEIDSRESMRHACTVGYRQGEKEGAEWALEWWKQYLYDKGFVGVIDACDEFVKALNNKINE